MPVLLILLFMTSAFAIGSMPVTRSVAEKAVANANLSALDSAACLSNGITLLEQFPNDVPAGKEVQRAISKWLPDAQEFFRERYTQLNNSASFYLYARSTNFSVPEQEVQAWIEREPDNSWLWLCYMATEWHKESPAPELVRERIEKSILLNPSRPEGYSFLGLYYDEQGDLKAAREAYESCLIADSNNEGTRSRLLDIYLTQRDSQAYFALINGVVPDQPLDVELGTIGSPNVTISSQELRGQVSLLVYWSIGSEICINHTLAEMNKAIADNRIKWPVYAIHVGGDSADASKFVEETDRNGERWKVNFVRSADAVDLRLNQPTKPCVFVVGADGYVHALLHGKGHEKDLLDTIIWLAEQVQSGM